MFFFFARPAIITWPHWPFTFKNKILTGVKFNDYLGIKVRIVVEWGI